MKCTTLTSVGLALTGVLSVLAAPYSDPAQGYHDAPAKLSGPSNAEAPSAPVAYLNRNASTADNATTGHTPGGERYVVLFDAKHPEPPEVTEILDRVGLNQNHPDIEYVFNNTAFRGFIGKMNKHCVDALNAMNEVKYVDPSVKISIEAVETRAFAPWGLQRISQANRVSPASDANRAVFRYKYERTGNIGQGVDIYVVDTGVNTAHRAFGGRARMGFSKDGPGDLNANSDGSGHGTHCAGTAAAASVGVASLANIIGVKILGADGSGFSSDVLQGIDYIIQNHNARRSQPGFIGSVASMSFGLSGRSASLEAAMDAAFDAGIHLSVAAGNEARDACLSTPASRGGNGADGQGGKAVAVGAMNINDQISSFSNTGRCVDVYAPGETVISTWIGGTDVLQILSGTSMAAPRE
jgi:cerevisin